MIIYIVSVIAYRGLQGCSLSPFPHNLFIFAGGRCFVCDPLLLGDGLIRLLALVIMRSAIAGGIAQFYSRNNETVSR